jgi:hypothetical protein
MTKPMIDTKLHKNIQNEDLEFHLFLLDLLEENRPGSEVVPFFLGLGMMDEEYHEVLIQIKEQHHGNNIKR